MTKKPYNNKFMLLALFIIFFAPLLLAQLFYSYKSTHHTGQTKNHGILIQPVVNLSTLILYDRRQQQTPLTDKWFMLYVLPNHCQYICQRAIYDIHQIHLALGDKNRRVKPLILSYTDQQAMAKISNAYPNTTLITMTQSTNSKHYDFIRKTLALQPGYIYLIDPRGNLMMRYLPQTDPNGILKDIKQLLKVSQIG